jgi:hypothetical protein
MTTTETPDKRKDDSMTNTTDDDERIIFMQAKARGEWGAWIYDLLDWWREAGAPRFGVGDDFAESNAWALIDPAGRRIVLAAFRADIANDPNYDYGSDPQDAAIRRLCPKGA